jgi:hypothetical protein
MSIRLAEANRAIQAALAKAHNLAVKISESAARVQQPTQCTSNSHETKQKNRPRQLRPPPRVSHAKAPRRGGAPEKGGTFRQPCTCVTQKNVLELAGGIFSAGVAKNMFCPAD